MPSPPAALPAPRCLMWSLISSSEGGGSAAVGLHVAKVSVSSRDGATLPPKSPSKCWGHRVA
eukprot:11164410-Lingulodinium_polyedra.AAC.1